MKKCGHWNFQGDRLSEGESQDHLDMVNQHFLLYPQCLQKAFQTGPFKVGIMPVKI